jgi:hypothetical protein
MNAWTFEITTGKLFDDKMIYQSSGYSGGNCGKNPEGKNNPADESLKDIGPIPEGLYRKGKLVPHSHLGVDAIELIPDPSNDMKGRSDLYMHGDTTPPGNASEGCVIQPHPQRIAWFNSDCPLSVVAHI